MKEGSSSPSPSRNQCWKSPLQQKGKASSRQNCHGGRRGGTKISLAPSSSLSHPKFPGNATRDWSVPTQSNRLMLPAEEAPQYHPKN